MVRSGRVRAVFLVLALVVALVALVAATRPALDDGGTGAWWEDHDKLAHLAVGAAFAGLLAPAFPPRYGTLDVLLGVLGATLALGVAIEALQLDVPGREPAVLDALATVGGVVLASVVAWVDRRAIAPA